MAFSRPLSRRDGSLLSAAVFLAFFAYALFQTAPHLTGGDCGEYVTAGAFLGNVHPPGNPVHHMLSFLAQRLPFGDAFGRSAALSALSAAGAVALLCAALLASGCGPLAAAGTSLLFGFSPLVMRNALVTEVYTLLLLHAAGLSLLFLRESRNDGKGAARLPLLLAFAAGLGMGIHYFAAIFAFPLFVSAWRRAGGGLRSLLSSGGLFLCGFAVMLYLPARALAHPPANFGDPGAPASFLRAVAWKAYYSRPAEGRTALLFLSQWGWAATSLAASLAPPVIPLAVVGAVRARREGSPAGPLLAGGLLIFAANVVLQNFPSRIMSLSELPRFLGPAAIPLVLLAGWGLEELFRLLGSPGARRVLGVTTGALFAAVVAFHGWRSASLFSRSGDFVIRDHLREAVLSLPPNAAVFTEGDTASFSALALHFVERMRTDLLPIDRTGNYMASLYRVADPAEMPTGPPYVERFLRERETSFIGSYPYSVAYVSLPDWARREGGWSPYGRIHILRREAGSPYNLPSSGPVRYGSNARTALDLKTRLYLASVLFRDLFASLAPPPVVSAKMAAILETGWDNPLVFVRYGDFLMDAGDPAGAEAAFRHALGVFPASDEARRQLGILLARTGRPEEAVGLLADPAAADHAEAQFYLANGLAHLGRPGEAVPRYEHAASLGYREPALYNNLGVAYARLGEPGKARRMFLEALRLDPAYRGARDNLDRLDAGGKINRAQK